MRRLICAKWMDSMMSKHVLLKKFSHPSATGRVYALPETMDFLVMYYRKDILSELASYYPIRGKNCTAMCCLRYTRTAWNFTILYDYMPFLFQRAAAYIRITVCIPLLTCHRPFRLFVNIPSCLPITVCLRQQTF